MCRWWLDEEEGPKVICGQGKEGDEFLGLDHFTLRDNKQDSLFIAI